LRLFRLSAIVSLCLAACASAEEGGTEPITETRIPAPQDAYGRVAWTEPNRLVVAYTPNPTEIGSETEIWQVEVATGRLSPLTLREPKECQATNYHDPTALSDGLVGVVRQCILDRNNPIADSFVLLQLSPTQQRETEIVSELGFDPIQFSWRPRLGKGIAARGDDTCSTLVSLHRGSVTYPSITIPGGQGTVVIDSTLVEPEGRTCTDKPRASWPDLSPDGQTVAFFASPESVGVPSQARLSVPWNLYTMLANGSDVQKHVEGILAPRSLVWSPDGGTLAFTGSVDGNQGVWVYSPDSDRLVRVSDASIDWLSWAPSGRQLAGVSSASQWPPRSSLMIYDVAEAFLDR
jgi:hypothetical protein